MAKSEIFFGKIMLFGQMSFHQKCSLVTNLQSRFQDICLSNFLYNLADVILTSGQMPRETNVMAPSTLSLQTNLTRHLD
jgi:hypothetical protein